MVEGVPLYSGRQLLLLFALLGAAAAGLAVREWRASHPELTDWLERLDRQSTVSTPGVGGKPAAAATDQPAQPPEGTAPAVNRPPVDLNSATPDDLARLPGVGPSLAARIVDRRQSIGAFASLEDLRRVKGIGPAKLERLRHLVTIIQ
jgi:competence protein ComEA